MLGRPIHRPLAFTDRWTESTDNRVNVAQREDAGRIRSEKCLKEFKLRDCICHDHQTAHRRNGRNAFERFVFLAVVVVDVLSVLDCSVIL